MNLRSAFNWFRLSRKPTKEEKDEREEDKREGLETDELTEYEGTL